MIIIMIIMIMIVTIMIILYRRWSSACPSRSSWSSRCTSAGRRRTYPFSPRLVRPRISEMNTVFWVLCTLDTLETLYGRSGPSN